MLFGSGDKPVAGGNDSTIVKDGDTASFAVDVIDASKEALVLVNFWASWCIPCRTETPYLERVWREYQDKDVMFIGVDIQDTFKDAQEFIDEFDVTYFTGPDFGSEIARAYNVQGLPQTFIINKNGDIDAVFVGEVFPPELETKLDELLAQPGP